MLLASQIVSGLCLASLYAADAVLSFRLVESVMRDVSSGWFMRYVHANGASLFMWFIYAHVARGL